MDLFKTQLLHDLFPPEPALRAPVGRMFVAALWRYKLSAAICLGTVLILGAGYLLFTPSLVETSSAVRVEIADLSHPGTEAIAGSLLAEQPEVMRSTPVVALAIASLDARRLPLLQGKKNRIEFVKSNLAIRTSGQTGIYDLTLTSSKPADAEKLLDALMAAYIQFEAAPSRIGAADAAALHDQQQKVDEDLAAARQQLNDILKKQKAAPALDARQRLAQERAELAASLASAAQNAGSQNAGSQNAGSQNPGSQNPGAQDPGAINPLQARFTLLTRQAQEYEALDDNAARQQAEVDRLVALSEGLTDRMRRSDQSQNNLVSVSVLKAPRSESVPVWPKPWPIIGISLLAGMLLASALVVGLDRARDNLHDARDARSLAKAPVLGRMPEMSAELSSPALRGQCALMTPAHSGALACRGICTALENLLVRGIDKMILITGPGNEQGKSVVASNLAIDMARSGQRVALVDAHYQNPMINWIFGIEDGVGLSSAIDGTLKLEDVLHVTGLYGLEILPTGSSETDWAALLNRPEFLAVLTELSERFDRVIIDGGPALADECRIISAFCDATVLVADERRCRRSDLQSAAQGLRDVGAKLAGIVLNHVPPQHTGVKTNMVQAKKSRRRIAIAASPQLAEPARLEPQETGR